MSFYIYENRDLNYKNLHKHLYSKIREKTGLKSQTTQSAIRFVIAKYKTILKKDEKWIKAVFKNPICELVYGREYYFTENNRVHISTMGIPLKLEYFSNGIEKILKDGKKLGTAKLQYKKGKFYLLIPVFVDCEVTLIADVKNVVGIDRGIRNIAVTYDSDEKTHFYSGLEIRNKRNKYVTLRQELQKKNTKSSKKRLKAINNREHLWMNDVNHCITKKMVELYPANTLFVLEDLSAIKDSKTPFTKKGKYSISSLAYADFERKLRYKATLHGQLVINIDPHYTSQQCPKCGFTAKNNRNHILHKFTCKKCGFSTNDDRVAAMNIYEKGRNLRTLN